MRTKKHQWIYQLLLLSEMLFQLCTVNSLSFLRFLSKVTFSMVLAIPPYQNVNPLSQLPVSPFPALFHLLSTLSLLVD